MTEICEENPEKVEQAEIIVGIPSYNEAELIAFPTKRASEGLAQFYPDRPSVIINCDNYSTDGTREAFLGVETEVPKIYVSTPEDVKSKASALQNLFKKAVDLKAKAVVVVDANLTSITPRWIKNLGDPLFKGFGFVAPLYVRHRFDGTIASTTAYPMLRALYGRRVRQPVGGDFGFSGQLAQIYLKDRNRRERISYFGIDIWMITLAINHGVPICQSFMGRPKGNTQKDPVADLGPLFNHVVGTLFALMDLFVEKWRHVKWSKPTAIFGFGLGEAEMPPDMRIDKKQLLSEFTGRFQQLSDLWKNVMAPENLSKLAEVAQQGEDRFDFPTELWAKVLFDYAIAFRREKGNAGPLLDSLQPLYYGKVLSFVNKVESMSIQQAEEYVEDQCLIFEETKPYLIRRWDDG